MDKYRIVLYLSDMTAELPVMPDKLTVKRSLDSAEKTVLELGNVNVLKGAKLRQISFSSFSRRSAFRRSAPDRRYTSRCGTSGSSAR